MKFDSAKGRFIRADGTEITSIAVTKNRGRWQYRADTPKGRVIASGMSPEVFAKEFWFAKEIEVI